MMETIITNMPGDCPVLPRKWREQKPTQICYFPILGDYTCWFAAHGDKLISWDLEIPLLCLQQQPLIERSSVLKGSRVMAIESGSFWYKSPADKSIRQKHNKKTSQNNFSDSPRG